MATLNLLSSTRTVLCSFSSPPLWCPDVKFKSGFISTYRVSIQSAPQDNHSSYVDSVETR